MSTERSGDAAMPRREFLKLSAAGVGGLAAAVPGEASAQANHEAAANAAAGRTPRNFNSGYAGEYLNQVAFPLGGIGAGMICLEGTGALSHVSLRNRPEVYNEPWPAAVRPGPLPGPLPVWDIQSGRSSSAARGRDHRLEPLRAR
jgi:hypothetical protein